MESVRVSRRGFTSPLAWGIAFALSAIASAAASAQGTGPGIDFFLQPEARISRVGGGTTVASGLNAGWMIGNKLILGGASFNTKYGIEPEVMTATGAKKADFKYSGGLLGWNFNHSPALSTSITTMVGRGSLQGSYDAKPMLAEKFWVFEPMANINLRAHRMATLTAGAGYRFVAGGRFDEVTKADVRSPTARIGVRIGL